MILGNKEIMSDKIWSSEMKIDPLHAEKYDGCTDPERKTSIVISFLVILHEDDKFDLLTESGGALIRDGPKVKSEEKDKGIPNYLMGAWMPVIEEAEQVIVIDMKDEDKNFSQRYLR